MSREMRVDLSSPREMVLTRRFDAPRELVWQCWTDPQHLAAWWGPQIMRNRVDQDFRPGGYQNITMIDPDGTEYPVRSMILEVEEGRSFTAAMLVEDHPLAFHEAVAAHAGGDSDGKLRATMTLTLEDAPGGKTLLTMSQRFPSMGERDANMKMGAEAGWGESFVKLDAHLLALS